MPFQCERCEKLFRDRCDLGRHVNRKNKCISQNKKIKLIIITEPVIPEQLLVEKEKLD
jgi:uncharacterized C2H2 Zn-finger protein